MELATIIANTPSDSAPVIDVRKMSRESFSQTGSGIDKKHTRANIKIQDGCDFYCAFCVIPFARGPARSRDCEDIFRECCDLVAAGHKEIVITGINLGTYNHDDKTLYDVIMLLERLDGLHRIRISSIEPTTIDKRLITLMADPNSKLCRYLHIPIQSATDAQLKGMARKYTLKEFDDFITFAYDTVPDVCIGTDVIVGFPGETPADFESTYTYLKNAPIHYFHVFSYSERLYARSKKMDAQVNPKIIAERSKRLRQLSDQKRKDYYESFIGKTQTVLMEQEKRGFWSGLTDNYIRIKHKADDNLKNKIINVVPEKFKENHLV